MTAAALHRGWKCSAIFARSLAAYKTWRRERKAIATLSALDDHTLMDMGVHPSQVHHVSRMVGENPGVDYRVFCQ